MLATSERIEILAEVDTLINMILHSEAVHRYRSCYETLQNNHEAQEKIRSFVRIKSQYEDVQRFGRYHPDYKEINIQTRTLKREMDLDECVAAFRKAENELQSMLDEISLIIGKSVSEYVKVPTGNPFFDSGSGCSGGCGSGGSCSCSA